MSRLRRRAMSSLLNMRLLLLLVVGVLCWVRLVRGLEAPPVHIPDQGIFIGTYLKMFRTQNIKAYLGIKYAEAARFAPPEVLVLMNRNTIWNASVFAPDCWQKVQRPMDKETKLLMSVMNGNRRRDESKRMYDESCLNLNIFIPDGSPGLNRYTVIVWFHGGDFSYGSPTDIDPFQLVFKQKVIVVTVAYRLNIFGFLSTGDGEAQGNFGLMDQSAALFWIRKNINYFGGNDSQITIMGHSAGAISVGLHLTSGEWSKDAFTKAIMMSGNPLAESAVKSPKEYESSLDTVASAFGCPRRPTSLFVQCLRRVDASVMANIVPPSIEWGPVIDYGLSNTSFAFIERYPAELFQRDMYQKVPTLMGVTDMEDVLTLIESNEDEKMTNAEFSNYLNTVAIEDLKRVLPEDLWCNNMDLVLDALRYVYQRQGSTSDEGGSNSGAGGSGTGSDSAVMKSFVDFHTDRIHVAPLYLLADVLSKHQKVFAYVFNMRPQTKFYTLPDWVLVPKYFEQIFIWGVPYMNNNNELVREWNSTDKKISDIVMTLWANFAKSSNPTVSNVYVKWNSYSAQNQTLLMINDKFDQKALNNEYITNFWNVYYPRVLRFSAECCNMTNSAAQISSFVRHPIATGFYSIALVLLCYVVIVSTLYTANTL